MYIKKKMRTKLILLAIVVLGFLYWRGVKQATAKQGLKCEYHIVYAICESNGKKTSPPGIWEIFKAGAKF